jgi:hypothetical protein
MMSHTGGFGARQHILRVEKRVSPRTCSELSKPSTCPARNRRRGLLVGSTRDRLELMPESADLPQTRRRVEERGPCCSGQTIENQSAATLAVS